MYLLILTTSMYICICVCVHTFKIACRSQDSAKSIDFRFSASLRQASAHHADVAHKYAARTREKLPTK